MLGFRVWDRELKCFSPDYNFIVSKGGLLSMSLLDYSRGLSSSDVQDRYTPMQSTDLKDKNGILIFEGDVLLTAKSPAVYCDCYEIVENVIDFLSSVYSGQPQKDLVHGYEIIGNIYKNPELMDKIK